ncbi:MAG: ATP-binding protein, partial [Xanthobacteraceae bacterium]
LNPETNELWATEHCRAILGLPSVTPVTRDSFLSAIHIEDREITIDALREAMKLGRSTVTDARVVMPDSKVRWVRVRARSHLADRGAANKVSGIIIDITERKTAETEAELQRLEVAHLMRVSVLGELSGAIAHEVNQPLTAILSNAQAALHLLRQNSPDLADVRDALQDIVDEDNRAGEIIRRLRSLLKKGQGKSERVDVGDLLNSTIALLRGELISRRIRLDADLASDLPAITGDSVQLQQVLLNLIMNAMDSMASTPITQRRVAVSARTTASGAIEVFVKDHGRGISPADQSRVFEPFYTTKEQGLGLGLTLCSTIIQAHGGKLTLSNNNSGGAVATIRLPVQVILGAAQ